MFYFSCDRFFSVDNGLFRVLFILCLICSSFWRSVAMIQHHLAPCINCPFFFSYWRASKCSVCHDRLRRIENCLDEFSRVNCKSVTYKASKLFMLGMRLAWKLRIQLAERVEKLWNFFRVSLPSTLSTTSTLVGRHLQLGKQGSKGAITSKIKHAMKLKTSPAGLLLIILLIKLLLSSLYCCSPH